MPPLISIVSPARKLAASDAKKQITGFLVLNFNKTLRSLRLVTEAQAVATGSDRTLGKTIVLRGKLFDPVATARGSVTCFLS